MPPLTEVKSHQFIDDHGNPWGEFKTFPTPSGFYWQAMIADTPPSGPFKSRPDAMADAQFNGRFID